MNPYQSRIERARGILETKNYEAMIATSTANFFYFTGVWIDPHERLLAVVIRKNGDPMILAPKMHEEDFVNCFIETVFWRDGEDAVALLASFLPQQGTISIDNVWPSQNLLGLMRHRPGLMFTTSTDTLGVLRRRKDEYEIDLLRKSGAVADRVMKAIISRVKPGIRENELIEELTLLWKQENIYNLSFKPIIGASKNGALPHHVSDETVIQSGDMVVIDMGGIFNHYCSDMTRTIAVGEATPKMVEVYEVVRKAQEAGLRTIRPGIAIGEVDRVTRDVITESGYGEYFIHRTGHGLGIEVHEEPYVYGDNELVIEPGMVFSVEPGIYLQGQFGVRIEDIAVATESGYESFNQFTKELVTVS